MIRAGLFRKFTLVLTLSWMLLLLQFQALAQSSVPLIDITKNPLSDTIAGRTLVAIDTFNRLTPQQFPVFGGFHRFPQALKTLVSTRQVEAPTYLKFGLQNSADTSKTICFYPGQYFDSITIYKANPSGSQYMLLPNNYPAGISEATGYREISMAAKEEALFIVKLQFVKTSVNSLNPRLVQPYFLPVFSKNLNLPPNGSHIATYIIVGFLTMMVIYSLAVFILNRTVEFLYYVLFAAFMAIMFFLKTYLNSRSIPFNHFYESYLDMMILCIATFFYLVFIQKFINAKTNFRFLFRFFNMVIALTIAGALLFSFFYFAGISYFWQNLVENCLKYLWTVSTVVFIIYAVIRKNKLLNYLAIGHFLYLLAIIIALILIQNPTILKINRNSIWRNSLFYTELGLTLELICFLLALAFKNRNNLIERTRERERLKMDNERKEFEKHLAVVQAKQEERNRISTDMHDELGSGVTAIRLMSEIMRAKMKENTLPEVDKISSSANELHSKMNTIIWTMSSSNDRLDNLVAYLRLHALEYLENTAIECHFKNPETIPPVEISGEKRRNIYLCIKETLNNLVKYSKASELWIVVNIVLNKLEITVQDNGVGINTEKLREFGNGLTNMKKRMESIGGSFSIENKNGTLSTFIIPL